LEFVLDFEFWYFVSLTFWYFSIILDFELWILKFPDVLDLGFGIWDFYHILARNETPIVFLRCSLEKNIA